MSSGLGNLTYLSKAMQDRIMSPDLTVEGLSDIMDQFVKWVNCFLIDPRIRMRGIQANTLSGVEEKAPGPVLTHYFVSQYM